MTEFDTLTDEELAQLEHFYFSPTWRAFLKVLDGRRARLKNEAFAAAYSHDIVSPADRAREAGALIDLEELLEARFNPPKEETVPEFKPKKFEDLAP